VSRPRALVLVLLFALVASPAACLFPSLGDLTGGDAAPATDASSDTLPTADAGGDASQADGSDGGGCPPNSDPSLIAYYQLDEGTGSLVHDCSGNHHDGIIMSTPSAGSWAPGHSGSAVYVDGSQGCIEIGGSPQLVLTSDVTATAWVRVEQYLSVGYIVGKTTDATYLGWRIATDSPSDFYLDVPIADYDAGNGYSAGVTNQLTGTWLHIAATFQGGGDLLFYVNGVQVDSTAGPAGILDDPNANVRIGCRADTSNFFMGLIDEVRIYNRALSAGEIAALAAQ
jgi:hypothetical protein